MYSGRNGPRYQAYTRYGYTCGTTTRLDNGEERFQWQKPPNEFDAIYNVKLGTQVRDLHFGTSTRADWETTMKNKRDSFNPNAGPGSYKRDKEFLISSESRNKEAPRFQDAPRQGMANMNGTPGPIYNVEKKYVPRTQNHCGESRLHGGGGTPQAPGLSGASASFQLPASLPHHTFLQRSLSLSLSLSPCFRFAHPSTPLLSSALASLARSLAHRYKRGVEKSIGIGFGRSKRKNLHLTSAADAMYAPKVEVPNFAVAFGEGDRFKYEAK
jgi:hypothetical protein